MEAKEKWTWVCSRGDAAGQRPLLDSRIVESFMMAGEGKGLGHGVLDKWARRLHSQEYQEETRRSSVCFEALKEH